MANDADARLLSVHVFGAAECEGIVLELPNSRFGVVDCFTASLGDPKTNPVLQFLESRGASTLEFVCLTHAHSDHYRGMSQILNRFDAALFWRPAAMTTAHLKLIIGRDKRVAFDARRKSDANELLEIFRLVRQQSESRRLIPRLALSRKPLYPDSRENGPVSIVAVAPSEFEIEGYQDQLSRCFDESGRLKERMPYADENRISIALLVTYGQTRVLLGGDVEEKNWQAAMSTFGPDALSADFVKVSHHGSPNGYCEGLWEAHARDGQPIAGVTAKRRSRLPTDDCLAHISEHACRIVTPCTAALRHRRSISGNLKSRMALHAKLRIQSASPLRPGRVTVSFDDLGNCVGVKLSEEAGDIS